MKRYICTWGAGYVRPGEREETEMFFASYFGYSPEDIEAVMALAVGETWTAPTNEVHTVKRIA